MAVRGGGRPAGTEYKTFAGLAWREAVAQSCRAFLRLSTATLAASADRVNSKGERASGRLGLARGSALS